jgi:hypothetical protein
MVLSTFPPGGGSVVPQDREIKQSSREKEQMPDLEVYKLCAIFLFVPDPGHRVATNDGADHISNRFVCYFELMAL